MAQRYREISFPTTTHTYIEHEIQEGNSQISADTDSDCRGGGQCISDSETFMVQWRTIGNAAEVVIESLKRYVPCANLKITCPQSVITGDISVAYSTNSIHVFISTVSTVHCVTLNASNLQLGLNIKSSESHPVETSAPIVQSHAMLTEDYGVVFSLVNADGSLIVVTIQDGVYEAIELKQTSLINSIWNRVRRSMMSGPDDNNQVVSSVLSDEHPTIYSLTKGFQLHQWSLGTWECVATYNLMNFVSANDQIKGASVRFFSSHPNSLLGVHLRDGDQSKILVLVVASDSGNVGESLMVVDCDETTVISYNIISDMLFMLTYDKQGQHNLNHISFTSSVPALMKAHLSTVNRAPVIVDYHQDPRELYTQLIFIDSKFDSSAILRAIHKLDPANEQTYPGSYQYNMAELKKISWDAVNSEVSNSVAAEEVANDEYRDLQIKVWDKFYANLIQYQEAAMLPLAVVNGGDEMPIALVRRSIVSYMRPCEPLELQILFPSDPLDDSSAMSQDVVALSQALALLKRNVEGFEDHIYQAILNAESVNEAINQVVQSIVKRSDHGILKSKFTSYIQNIHLLKEGVAVFRHFLNLVNHFPEQMDTITSELSEESNPFCSLNETGSYILCTSVHDMAKSRYNLCCSLLLFLEYLTYLSEETSKSEEIQANVEEMTSTLHVLLRAYSAILWISRLSHGSDRETSPAMVEVLKIGNGDGILRMMNSNESGKTGPLLGSYLTGIGGLRVKALMSTTADDSDYYQYLNSLIIATCQALWPETTDVLFPQYLLANNELLSLQTYCRLLDGYSKSSTTARTYLLGQSYLIQKEPLKAYSCFMTSLYGMFEEGQQGEEAMSDGDVRSQQLEFCFKVMNIFEEFSYSEQVIQMAHQTMKFSDSEKETLLTKIFKHSVELGHYDDAFRAILTNTDQDRKMNCLHQFVNALCEKGELRTLVSYPYKDVITQQDLRPAVISILLSKARSVDLTVKNYYDLLYSFHVVNNDLLSAANVMYECCERLNSELSGLSALQKKAKCYLACIHALECVRKQSAWISPPIYDSQAKIATGRRSPKRTRSGGNKNKPSVQSRVLLLSDIKKEYMLVNMSLRLATNGCKQITGSSYMEADDLVGLLSNTGMYDEAIEVCLDYELSLSQVFQSLTFRCIRMRRELNSDNIQSDEDEEAIRWLTYNRLPIETSYASSCDQAWKILRHYLDKYETVSSIYHKVVANKLLANNTSLPEWLIASYKLRNAGELIRVYLQHDLIEESVDLCADLLNSLTTATYDRFGFESALSATMNSSSVCVPYTSIDVLINILDEYQQDPYYLQLYTKLKKAVDTYTRDLEEKSGDAERRLNSMGNRDHRMTSMNWT